MKRRRVESVENQVRGRENDVVAAARNLASHEFGESEGIGFLEFIRESIQPRFLHQQLFQLHTSRVWFCVLNYQKRRYIVRKRQKKKGLFTFAFGDPLDAEFEIALGLGEELVVFHARLLFEGERGGIGFVGEWVWKSLLGFSMTFLPPLQWRERKHRDECVLLSPFLFHSSFPEIFPILYEHTFSLQIIHTSLKYKF